MAERVQCLYRVSTTKQVDHNDQNQADIPMQRKSCREFAKKMGWTIVGEEQETGVSGFKVSAGDRDKLQLVKEKAEQGKFDILLVFMFDRLGRRSDETPFVVEWFVKKGIHVWSVNEGEQRFEFHTDRLTNYIRFWQADGESQKTSIRTKTALSQMVLEETRQRVLDTSRRVTELTLELENENSRVAEMQAEFDRIATWSEIFDSSDIATKKMICGYIIKRVTVYRDYKLDVEFNITVKQFLNGIDSVEPKDNCMAIAQ